MADSTRQAETLMRDVGIDALSLVQRKKYVGLDGEDARRLTLIRPQVLERSAQLAETFFEFLGGVEEVRPFVSNRALLDRARALKTAHLEAMVSGEYGMTYVEQRLELGLFYAKVGVGMVPFLGAFNFLLKSVGTEVMKGAGARASEVFDSFMSLEKVAFFDIGLIIDVLMFERERVIRQQAEAIRELSTPVLQIRDRLLLLPLIGVIDTQRARSITESLLGAVRASRARVVVMDVTGVATIDSKVANHLLQAVSAARLMGATVVITGLSAEVAQSLVALGIDLTSVNTVGDLQGGLEEAERVLGERIISAAPQVG